MPSSVSIILITSLTTLWLGVNARQQCYYPDGSLSTTDTPCNSSAAISACCKSSAYCLANGLCLENGILNRESCTDKNWTSENCPQYCKSESTSSTSSPIMPCTNITFTCGLYPNDCAASASTFQLLGSNSIVLRPSQLNSAISSSGIPSSSNNSTPPFTPPTPSTTFTPTQLAATSLGISLPLLLIISILSYLLFREKKRHKAIDLHHDQAFYRSSTPGIREINTCSWSAWSDRTRGRGADNSVLDSIRELSPAYQQRHQQQVF